MVLEKQYLFLSNMCRTLFEKIDAFGTLQYDNLLITQVEKCFGFRPPQLGRKMLTWLTLILQQVCPTCLQSPDFFTIDITLFIKPVESILKHFVFELFLVKHVCWTHIFRWRFWYARLIYVSYLKYLISILILNFKNYIWF